MTTTLDISMITYIKLLEADKEFEKYGLTWLSYGIVPHMRSEYSNVAYEKFKQHYKIKHMQTSEFHSTVRLHFTSEEHLCWFKLKNL